MKDQDRQRILESRIHAMLDGTISEEDFHHLEDELSASPESRQLYYQYTALHQGLEFRLSRSNNHTGIAGLADARLERQRARTKKYAIFAAAAILIIGLITMQMFFIKQEKPSNIAEVEFAPGTLFTMEHTDDSEASGSLQMAPESRLQVSQGTIELTFPTGVKAIVQGPADMTLHDVDKLYLDTGIGWFEVPDGAEGFTVKTRELNIIDLGTEFGVVSDPDKDDEVHVFKGKVKVEALYGVKKETTLTTGSAVNVRPYGRFQTKQTKLARFMTQLPKTLAHMHWSFDNPQKPLATNTIADAADIDYQIHHQEKSSPAQHFSDGKFGNALSLDGTTSFLETDWPGILGATPRTVAFWLKLPNLRAAEKTPSPTNHLTAVAWGTQQGNEPSSRNINSKWTIHFDYTPNRAPALNISFGGFWYHAPKAELDDNAWHHITVTYSGTSHGSGHPVVQLYIDGKTHPLDPALLQPARIHKDGQVIIDTLEKTPLVIGAAPSARPNELIRTNTYLQAEIDELYIIKGVIDAAAVKRLKETNRLSH